MEDTKKSILKSAGQFFSGTMLSRITGLFRDITMAFAFGTGASVAAFFVAFRLSQLLRRMIGEGALQSAFIPSFEEIRKDDPDRAYKFFQNLYSLLSKVLLILVGSGMATLGAILYGINLSEGNREIIRLTLIMLPGLYFICLYGLNSAFHQCEKRYFKPSAAPVIFNCIWIAGILIIWNAHLESIMEWLSLFIVLGLFFQWLITRPKDHIRASWKLTPDLLKFGKPLALGILGVCATQVNNALDVLFARYAQSDGPALLWYALRLQHAPLGLFGIALSGAILPPLARAYKNNEKEKYWSFFLYGIKKAFYLMLPITIILFFFGDLLINLIYGRGNFTSNSILATTPCLQAYSLGLIPMALILILAPSFYSRGNYTTPMLASTFSVGLNIGLNSFFVMGLGWGAFSVALATAISAWANLIYLGVNMNKQPTFCYTKN